MIIAIERWAGMTCRAARKADVDTVPKLIAVVPFAGDEEVLSKEDVRIIASPTMRVASNKSGPGDVLAAAAAAAAAVAARDAASHNTVSKSSALGGMVSTTACKGTNNKAVSKLETKSVGLLGESTAFDDDADDDVVVIIAGLYKHP